MLLCAVITLIYSISVLCLKANKNLDMSINASENFNLNITWSVGSTGTFRFTRQFSRVLDEG